MENEPLAEKIEAYARVRQLLITRKLGSGNQGTVFAALSRGRANEIALKFHNEREPYVREKLIYERLAELSMHAVQGFNIPEMHYADDDWLVLQMSIVRRPFVLDFAGAYLDAPPLFSDEIWEEWREQKIEMFEDRWALVEEIIGDFEAIGIHLMDVHPRNIAFLE